MIITVSKKELFDEVEKRSSLEGSVLPERFEGVWASEEEGKFLDSYWVEGYTAVVQLMKRYLTGQTITYDLSTYDKDEVLTINATMPKRYNSLLDGSVATDVKMLIACNILHGWLEVKAPEAAAKYEEEAKGYTEDMRVKLLYRNEPTANMVAADNDASRVNDEGMSLAKGRADAIKVKDEGMSIAKGDADKTDIELEGLPIGAADTDNDVLKEKEGEGLYASRPMENEVNVYPSHEYIGEKCSCGEVPMKQGWNGCSDHGWYEEQQRIARESIMCGGCL